MSIAGDLADPRRMKNTVYGFVPYLFTVAPGSYVSSNYGAFAADTTATSMTPTLSSLELSTGVQLVGTSLIQCYNQVEVFADLTTNKVAFDVAVTLNRQAASAATINTSTAEVRIKNSVTSQFMPSGLVTLGVVPFPQPWVQAWPRIYPVEFLDKNGQILLGPAPTNSGVTSSIDHFARVLNDGSIALLTRDYSTPVSGGGSSGALRPMVLSNFGTLFAAGTPANDVLRISIGGTYYIN